MIKHRERLAKNPRIAMLFKGWDKQGDTERKATLDYAECLIADLNAL
jgi:deoxyribodipyrimidine photolyase-related protein